MRKLVSLLILLFMAFPLYVCAETSAQSAPLTDNPLINREAGRTSLAFEPSEGIINFLLIGMDSDEKDTGYLVEDNHTDAMIVMAVNPKANRIDLISIPRDTMAYVPGTRGVYKINGAINVGSKRASRPTMSAEGFEAVRDTVSWLLGGIRIDHYLAVNMEAMAEIGNAIGGIDFNVEMSYAGEGRKIYRKGMQHLDGQGIVDYFQARKNATVNPGSDLARTGRQRALLTAIMTKLMVNPSILLSLTKSYTSNEIIRQGFFTDMDLKDLPSLMQLMLTLSGGLKSSGTDGVFHLHVISGAYRNAFGNWKFTFTDQENRREVIRQVYGVDVPELKYVSYSYAKWLYTSGFRAIRHLSASDGIRKFMDENPDKAPDTDAFRKALEAFNLAYDRTRDTFILAAETMDSKDTQNMTIQANKLKEAGNALAKLLSYPKKNGKVVWSAAKYHDEDRLVNEVYVNFR